MFVCPTDCCMCMDGAIRWEGREGKGLLIRRIERVGLAILKEVVRGWF